MAEAAVQSPTSSSSPKYFCHKCSVSVDLSPELPDLTCPRCESGFIEEMTQDLEEQHAARNQRTGPSHSLFDRDEMPSLLSNLLFTSATSDDRSSDQDFRDEDESDDDEEEYTHLPSRYGTGGLDRRLFRRRRAPRGRSAHSSVGPYESTQSRTVFPRFLEGLLRELTGNSSGRMPGFLPLLPPLFHGDPRDYAWGADGLDNAITQLLNQWETPGSPPASTDDINGLQSVAIMQEHIDKEIQCSVCMDDFALDENVLSLPCQHLFHSDCIKPWLQLHNTCPICRQALGDGVPPDSACAIPASQNQPRRERLLTDSSSDSSSDDDDDWLGATAAPTMTTVSNPGSDGAPTGRNAAGPVGTGRTSDGEEKKDMDKPTDDREAEEKVRQFSRHRYGVVRRPRVGHVMMMDASSSSSSEENYDTA